MPTPTYDLIASNVLSSSASSVTFSSIPATYRDLVISCSPISTTNDGTNIQIRFNGDTGNNYPYVWAKGSGSAATSGSNTTSFLIPTANELYVPNVANVNSIIQIMDYSATDKHKTVLSRTNQTSDPGAFGLIGTIMVASRWASTSAVNSIVISAATSWASGSSFHLYGIVS